MGAACFTAARHHNGSRATRPRILLEPEPAPSRSWMPECTTTASAGPGLSAGRGATPFQLFAGIVTHCVVLPAPFLPISALAGQFLRSGSPPPKTLAPRPVKFRPDRLPHALTLKPSRSKPVQALLGQVLRCNGWPGPFFAPRHPTNNHPLGFVHRSRRLRRHAFCDRHDKGHGRVDLLLWQALLGYTFPRAS